MNKQNKKIKHKKKAICIHCNDAEKKQNIDKNLKYYYDDCKQLDKFNLMTIHIF